jgi:TonB-linked SusC/RagA family outer membrane protein
MGAYLVHRRPQHLRRWAALVLAAVLPGSALAQSGRITGRITDANSGAPVGAARVFIAGTAAVTQSGDDGRYTLRGVQAGTVEVTVTRLGYEAKKTSVAASGEATTLDLTLSQVTYSLAEVVTTVTGQQRKVELGNTISTISVGEKLAETPVRDLGQLLNGRAAGVQVTSAGATGTGSRIRIRGQASFGLSNEPLVYVDGVRIISNTGSSSLGVGGSSPSRLNDINPEEIENIEIIKGPSAATLYGTEAANGVINITTKKGKAGKTVWNFYSENGTLYDPNTYPLLYYGWGTLANGTSGARCVLTSVPSGACRMDSVTTVNVLNEDRTTVLSTGLRQQYGAQLSGGTERVQFFGSGEWEDELGNYKMSQIEIDRLKKERGVSSLPDEQIYPNKLNRISLRTNLNAAITPKADLQVSSGFITSDQRLPQNEDNGNGLMVAALGGLGRRDLTDSRGIPLNGYRSWPMGDVFSRTTTQGINRFVNSFATQYRPASWLNARTTVGVDITSRVDEAINLFDQGTYQFPARSGQINNQRTELHQYTVDAGLSANKALWGGWTSKTSVGLQYFRNYFGRTGASGETLPPGGRTLSLTSAARIPSQATDETITLGTYLEAAFAWNERLFLTGAIRADDNSAFGDQFNIVLYPKFSASWVASEESFFPKWNWLQTFRLRTTYGASGQQPGTTDALRFYSGVGTTLTGQVEAPGVSLGALGNADLKPEYSYELEGGFDANMLNGKLNLELSYYRKQTRDAIIDRQVAPSLGFGVSTRFENIGSVRNQGLEILLNSRLLDRSWAGIDVTITGSTNENTLLKLGTGVSPIFTGNRNTQYNVPGYPLFGMWGRPMKFADANNDGVIVGSEITYDTLSYVGPSFPTKEFAISPTIELLKRKLRINTQFDYKGGMRKLNNTLRHQCQGGQACRGLYDKTAPLERQAAAVAANVNVFTNFYEEGDFTRFRELSVAYQLPDTWARKVRAARLSLIGSGRNLAVWTNYTGVDPEATVGNSDTRGNEEFFSTPPLRAFNFRVALTF